MATTTTLVINLEFASAIPDPTEESHALPEDRKINAAIERLCEDLDPDNFWFNVEAVRG